MQYFTRAGSNPLRLILLFFLFICLTVISCGQKEDPEAKRQAFLEETRKRLYERVEAYHNYSKADKPEQMAGMILPRKNLQIGQDKIDNSVDFFLAAYRSPLVNTLLSYKIENITLNPTGNEAIVRMQLITRNRDGERVIGSEMQKWKYVYDTWYYDFTEGIDGWK